MYFKGLYQLNVESVYNECEIKQTREISVCEISTTAGLDKLFRFCLPFGAKGLNFHLRDNKIYFNFSDVSLRVSGCIFDGLIEKNLLA